MSGGDPHDRPSGRALASILIALLAAAAFQVFYLRLVEPPQGAYAIDSMRFLPGPAAGPARVPMSAGEQRSLPDDWLRTAPDVSEGWYVAELPDAAWQARAWGIYLPVVHMNTEIFLNDRLIARSRQFDARRDRGDPYARETNRPVYVPVPGYLDGSRVRRLRIHVESQQPGSGLLGPVYIGPDAVLSAAYGKRLAARVTTVQVVSAGMLTIAILMSVLWYLRREDSVYGWFALLVYAWALHNVFFLGLDTPLSDRFEDWVAVVALGWFVVLMAFTTHRYLGLHPVRLEHGILALAVSWSLVLAAPAWLGLSEVAAHRVWSTFALVLGGYSIARIALAYRYRQDLRNPFVLPAGLAVLLLGTHDWLLVMGLWPREDGLLMHFCAPFTLIVFASMLLERFSGVLREAESLSRELEQRVAEKHRILEDNFSKLRRMENRQILAEERERFMKEMHDGVGGHLISMLSMIRGGESDLDKIRRAIEAALGDLRIMIDSLDPDEHDIPSLLGALRARLEPQLAGSRLKFEWQVSDIPPLPDFGPRKALQVMRIVQEAVTNIINHAEAGLIRIRARVETDHRGGKQAVLDVMDDGKGFAPDVRRGHGLNNMEQRAASIDASLEIEAANPGTRVRLRFPYD